MDKYLFYSLIILLTFFNVVYSFNYYVNPSEVIKENVLNFGYALSLQENRLLVGSPKIDISNTLRDFNGSVFACENFSNCKPLVGFGHKNNLLGLSLDVGLSRTSSAIICEPRFLEFDKENQFPVGRCFTYKNNAISEIINPLKSIDNVKKDNIGSNVYFAGMSESGFSVKRIKDQLSILGAPGYDNWKGCLLEYSKPNVQTFPVGINNYDYAGYDVAFVRRYTASVVWYVVGAPRANNLLGGVIIVESPEYFNSKKKVFESFQGQQFGEYFGSSLCTADLNGDGFDDIIVGSPTYRSNKFDEGKVTVYFSNNNNGIFSIQLHETIFGQMEGGKFGTTIANLGKLFADDTIDSIAISAPYEHNGKGTVYIYRRLDRKLKLYQTILPSKKKSLGFGISITNTLDIDANQFNDFAVAAYQSSEIYIVKARPIVKLTLYNIKSSIDKILIGKTESFSIEFCISFQSQSTAVTVLHGVNIDVTEEYLNVIIDIPKEVVNISLQCFKRNIKTRKFTVQDSKPIIKIRISASLPYRDTNCSTCPIEDPNMRASKVLTLPISPDCGSDDICTPVYEIHFNHKAFLVGSTNTLTFEVDVRNVGEPAYVCDMIVALPEDINIAQTNCERISVSETNSLKCSLGNPLKTKSLEKVKIHLDVSNLDISKKELCFKTEISSYGNFGNVLKNLCIPLEYKRHLDIKGISVPSMLTYDMDYEGYNNLTHEFLITNTGPSTYKDFSIKFFVPYFPDPIKFNDKEGHILDIYDPIAFVDNIQKLHICSIVNDYRTLSSQLAPTKKPPRAERNVDEIIEQYSISNRDVLHNVSLADMIELGETNVIEILCSIEKLQTVMILKIPIRFSVPRMKILYEKELETKNMITWGTNGYITVDQKEFQGIAITILDYSSSGLKTWQYALIITFATIIGIAVLGAIAYTLYKVGFFSRPLKERMDAMEMKLVDVPNTDVSNEEMEDVDISSNSNKTMAEDAANQETILK